MNVHLQLAWAATAVALAGPLSGRASDPVPVSPACAQALHALETARQERRAAGVTERLRQRAIQACLGAEQAPPQPTGRMAQPPVAVPAIPVLPAPPASAPTAIAPPPSLPPPVAIERPRIITQCDAAGCWDSEGQRLTPIGSLLSGPRGPCMPQGGGYVCP